MNTRPPGVYTNSPTGLDRSYDHLTHPQLVELSTQLDTALRWLVDENRVCDCLELLFTSLQTLKLELDEKNWQECVQVCRAHPVLTVLHEDPFTHRAFYKPRRYAGDAVMLDYIYGQEDYWPLPKCTALGKQIFDYTTLAPASAGVRARRGYIADALDMAAFELTRPHVMSIAAGHFREAEMSSAIRRRRFGRVVALDADPQSLKEVESRYGRYGVETIAEPLMSLLKGTVDAGQFDVIYSLGLFDYLKQSIGRRLVTKAFDMLRPGGRLIVANFLPGIHDIGYMEAVMDWKLIYRTREEMIGLTTEIAEEHVQNIGLESEENRNIIFLTIRKTIDAA